MEMNNVRVQASKLSAEAAQLAEVRSRLRTYRSELETCWQGAEVTVLLRAVDQALAQVTAAEKELQELANAAQEAAKAIRAEEQAEAKAAAEREKQQREAAEEARRQGLGLNAGHDLNLENLRFFVSRIPWTDEVSIGHALICDALYYGLENTVQLYKRELR